MKGNKVTYVFTHEVTLAVEISFARVGCCDRHPGHTAFRPDSSQAHISPQCEGCWVTHTELSFTKNPPSYVQEIPKLSIN